MQVHSKLVILVTAFSVWSESGGLQTGSLGRHHWIKDIVQVLLLSGRCRVLPGREVVGSSRLHRSEINFIFQGLNRVCEAACVRPAAITRWNRAIPVIRCFLHPSRYQVEPFIRTIHELGGHIRPRLALGRANSGLPSSAASTRLKVLNAHCVILEILTDLDERVANWRVVQSRISLFQAVKKRKGCHIAT